MCTICKKPFEHPDYIKKITCSKKCTGKYYSIKFSGRNSPNFDVKRSRETREKMSSAKLGVKNPMYGKLPWNKGIPWSIETTKKISNTKKRLYKIGRIVPWNKGKKNVQIVWNKGLNKNTDKRISLLSFKLKEAKKRLLNDPIKSIRYRKKLSRIHKELYLKFPEERQRLIIARSKIVYPKKNTSIEIKMQQALKQKNIDFIINFPFYNSICETRIDIAIPDKKIAIFCDGDYWHNLPTYKKRDRRINLGLIKGGWKVFRFWENEINSNVDNCASKVMEIYRVH